MDDRADRRAPARPPPRAFRRVVVRCPFGRPAVTEQAPYDENGDPFPTTFWLTCPHLVAAVSRLEAAGGVERWTSARGRDPELASSLQDATAEQRRLRPELPLGIGGASRDGQPQVPARARRVRARAPRLRARRPDPRGGPVALAARALLHASSFAVVSRADRTRRLGARLRRARGAEAATRAATRGCSTPSTR